MQHALTPTGKPKKVKQATILIILSITIAFIYGIIKAMVAPEHHSEGSAQFGAGRRLISAVLLVLLVAAIIWLFLYNINTGKIWARVICTIYLSASIFIFCIHLPYPFSVNIIRGLVFTISHTLEGIALVFLNSKEVLEWYKQKGM